MVIMSLVFGTGVVSRELEQKTIVYLLTRPVPRWMILAAKILAAFVVVTAALWLSAILLALVAFFPHGLGPSRLGRDLAILPVGVLAYTSVFVCLATAFQRALLVGLFFAFGWESWVPSWPGSFQKVSLMTHLRVLAPHPVSKGGEHGLMEMLSGMLTAPSVTSSFAWTTLFTTTLVALLGALFIFSTREYAPRDDAE